MIKLKTLIVIHRLILKTQWEESLIKFCPNSKVQFVKTNTKINTSNDFFIVMGNSIPKLPEGSFSHIGTVIYDELHAFGSASLCQSLQYLSCRYLLGLSASPTRPDGLFPLLECYFGNEKIQIKMNHPHTVYKIFTDFEPEVKMTLQGKMDWNSVLEFQATNEERNKLIVKIVRKFPERTFLLLCKRVEHSKRLKELLEKEGEKCDLIVGNKNTYDKDSRVIIATASKAGLGFSHDKLDTLLLCSDLMEYFSQYLGRVFRTEEVEPIVFDIVDKNGVLISHFYKRRKVYLESGGIIKNFYEKFPEFCGKSEEIEEEVGVVKKLIR